MSQSGADRPQCVRTSAGVCVRSVRGGERVKVSECINEIEL